MIDLQIEKLTDSDFKLLLSQLKNDKRFGKIFRELQKENKSLGITRENGKHTRLYRIYTSMKIRCSNSCTGRDRKNYYEKGIRVCEEWKNNFQNFYEWSILNGYSDKLSIDRIDVSKNYEPENCRWVTMFEQQSNKSNNRIYTYNGKTQHLAKWSREYDIEYNRLFSRLKSGWDFERALLEPVHKDKIRKEYKK